MLTDKQAEKINQELRKDTKGLPLIFAALGDKTRYYIFKLLILHQDLCVTDIASVFNVTVPAASQQLKILETSGLIQRQRNGQMICYTVHTNNAIVSAIIRMLKK